MQYSHADVSSNDPFYYNDGKNISEFENFPQI